MSIPTNLGNLNTRTGKVVHAPESNGSERAHTLCKPYGSMYRARPGMNYDIVYYVTRGSVTCKSCLKAIDVAYGEALTEDVAWTDRKAHQSERNYHFTNSAMDIYHAEALEMEAARVAEVEDAEQRATKVLAITAEMHGTTLDAMGPSELVALISGASLGDVARVATEVACAWPWQSVRQSRNGVLLAVIVRLAIEKAHGEALAINARELPRGPVSRVAHASPRRASERVFRVRGGRLLAKAHRTRNRR